MANHYTNQIKNNNTRITLPLMGQNKPPHNKENTKSRQKEYSHPTKNSQPLRWARIFRHMLIRYGTIINIGKDGCRQKR